MKNNSTMKNLSNFNLLIIILLFSSCRQQPFTGTVHIIPYPNQIAIGTQYRPIGKNLSIYLSPESGMDKDYIEDLLSDTGVKCKFTNFKWIADLTFDIEPDTIGLEGYRLVSNDYGTKITASNTKGLFYGLQTFRQLITSQNNTLVIPFVEIADSPKFLWRALMLDEGRYFKGKKEVKKLLDEMARLKMNTFHWHLTDDQGWRIEIKKYPLLTKIGGKRDSTQIGNWNSNIYDGKVHEGFYTQEEIKEIIDYAAKRQITIVPEIEMPGHASAAIAAYPQLGTEKQSIKVPTRFGVQYHAYNVADPKVIQFIKDVLDEVCNLFPSETIHIGGDEVPKGSWTGSPLCHKFMEEKGMKDTHELSEYFLENITEMLSKKGVKTSGWQEVALHHSPEMNARIAPRFAGVYCWSTIGKRDVVPYTVANEGYDVILCNVNNLYIDLAYNPHKDEPGLTWGGYVNEFTSFNILPYNIYCSARENTAGEKNNLKTARKGKIQLTEQSRPRIKGVQAQLFSETIGSFDMVQYYVFPKIFGLVERGWNAYPEWSPVPNDDKQALYEKARAIYNAKIAEIELPRLAADGFNFRVAQPGIKIVEGKLYANSPIPQAEIRYTTDGSEPTATSTLWEAPVDCSATVVKAKLFYLGKESHTTDYKND